MKDADPEVVRNYVKTAEEQYRDIKDADYLLARPLIDFLRTPICYYRVGVLLGALEVGFHDVLEFGAGTCWLGAILYRLGSRVVFFEVSSTALELGKKLIKEIKPLYNFCEPPKFLLYDGFSFPLPDESMDRIVCHDAFHHVPNPKRILEEMYRVLRPGGRIAFAEPGEGHSELPAAKEDMRRDGVLEADVHFGEIYKAAKEIGFKDVFFMVFPKIETMTLNADDYLAFQNGDNNTLPLDEIRKDLKYFQTIILTKGPDIVDTRYPHDLRARIEIIQKPRRLKRGAKQLWKVKFTNIGDTTWLSPKIQIYNKFEWKEKKSGYGGYVWIRVLLRDENGNLLIPIHYDTALPKDIRSRENVEIEIELEAPAMRGKYIYEFDLELRNFYMFSDKHRNPWYSESLKEPVEVI